MRFQSPHLVYLCLVLAALMVVGMLVLWWRSPSLTQMQFLSAYWFGYFVAGLLVGIAVAASRQNNEDQD